MAKVICFSNQKGGVGKTTTCVTTAAGLTQRGRRVLTIDMDSQASATIYVGATVCKTIYDLFIDGQADLHDAISSTVDFGDIIPGATELADITADKMSPLMLKVIVDELREEYDFILIDTPPNLGWLQVSSLNATDAVVIPTRPTGISVEGVATLITTIAEIQERYNPDINLTGILFTQTSKTRAAEYITDEMSAMVNGTTIIVYNNSIRYVPASLNAAEIFHESIFKRRQKEKLVDDYNGFIDQLLIEVGDSNG